MDEPTEKQLVEIADYILKDLLGRSGIGDQLSILRADDAETYREIQISIGRRAWDVVIKENKPKDYWDLNK